MQSLSLDTPRGAVPAVLARPDGDGPFPGVVVIHDITGMAADTRRHCQNFADAGYVALAPDLMAGGVRCVVSTLATMFTGKGTALDTVQVAREVLAAHDDVDADRIAVVGFCLGGGFALLAAADGAFAVAAPFYGRVPASAERLEGICPTIAQFGAQDLVFKADASRLSRHLRALGVEHEVIVRPGVGHSFMNQLEGPLMGLGRYTPMRAFYDAPTEAEAWKAMMAFFEAHMSQA